MSSTESKEKKATRTIEKIVMSFMYLLFGAMLLVVALSGEPEGFKVVLPIAVLSIGLAKWGIKWQNDRYVRSAKNVDDIEILSEEIKQLKKRIEELENK
tara:strand:- start:2355 stop:2651 length:297 start_codon:yes stop_codon:yes gene_type:complete